MSGEIHAYVVTLIFGPGPVHQGTTFAATSDEAVARITYNVMRKSPPAEDLTGMACMELPAAWLRSAVQAIETGKPSGEVLSLVPKPDPEAA